MRWTGCNHISEHDPSTVVHECGVETCSQTNKSKNKKAISHLYLSSTAYIRLMFSCTRNKNKLAHDPFDNSLLKITHTEPTYVELTLSNMFQLCQHMFENSVISSSQSQREAVNVEGSTRTAWEVLNGCWKHKMTQKNQEHGLWLSWDSNIYNPTLSELTWQPDSEQLTSWPNMRKCPLLINAYDLWHDLCYMTGINVNSPSFLFTTLRTGIQKSKKVRINQLFTKHMFLSGKSDLYFHYG